MDLRKYFGRSKNKSFLPNLPRMSDGFFGTRVKNFEEKNDQLLANVGWVYAANDTRAEMCAAVPVHLHDKKTDDIVEDHQLVETLHNPNQMISGYQMKKMYFIYRGLTGENYWLRSDEESEGIPLALHVLPSHACHFFIGDTVESSYVEYQGHRYNLDQVVRDVNPDPYNPYHGRGVVAAAAGAIDTDISSQNYNRNFFANQARPSAVINVEEPMSDEVANRFKQEVSAIHTGVDSAGKPMILEGKINVTPYALSQKEMDYLASRKFTKDEILAMFRVSPGMLGMVENVNRSNMEASDTIFAKSVLVPELTAYVNMLNTKIVPENLREKYEFRFENPVPEDKEHELKEVTAGVGRWITPNEARAQMGLDEIDGGDVLQRDPLEDIEIPDPTKAIEDLEARVTTEMKAIREEGLKKKLYSSPDEREELGELYAGVRNKRLTGFEGDFAKASRKYFNAVKKDTLALVRKSKKQFKKKGIDDMIPGLDKHKQMYIGVMLPIYEELIEREGVQAFMLVTGATDFDVRDPDVQKFMDARSSKVAASVSDETEKQLRATLTAGLSSNETTAELGARVEEVLGVQAAARAQRIARTESTRTASEAQVQAWNQSGVVDRKEWYVTRDERTCEHCGPHDGKVIALNGSFHKQGEVFEGNRGGKLKLDYEDVGGPPLHPSCRCILLPLLEQ